MTRHHNLEHRRTRPEPFTVRGTLGIVLDLLGMSKDTSPAVLERSLSGYYEFMHSGKACAVVAWECAVADDGLPIYTVKSTPVEFVTPMATKPAIDKLAFPGAPVYVDGPLAGHADPWVVVGRTTIDGDNETIAEAFGLEVHGLLGVIQALREDGRVLQAGGRNVRIHDTNLDPEHGGIVECDIVRHKSEIDAERRAHIDFVSKWAADPWRIRPTVMRQVCQECGPHGNAGRVLLLESWVDCTMCRPPETVDVHANIPAYPTADDVLKMKQEACDRVMLDFVKALPLF